SVAPQSNGVRCPSRPQPTSGPRTFDRYRPRSSWPHAVRGYHEQEASEGFVIHSRHALRFDFRGSYVRPLVLVLWRSSPKSLNKEVRKLLHILKEAIATFAREDALTFPFRFSASVLWEEGMSNGVAKFIKCCEV